MTASPETEALRRLLVERIRAQGPLTFAAFMEAALYEPELGYYARGSQRSGREGDFFTSVDVGPLFGELLARQFGEMWRHLGSDRLMLVETAAGNGRLARDVLDAARAEDPAFYDAIELTLVERSAAARAAQEATLAGHAGRLVGSPAELPDDVTGIIYANELLDALPVHRVAVRAGGLREIWVDLEGGQLVERDGPLSTPAVTEYLERAGAILRPGWEAEVNLAAVAWVKQAARALARGFLVIVDYGHEAAELYSASHAAGTLMSFRGHRAHAAVDGARGAAPWLAEPGGCDLTTHVDFSAVRDAACQAGLGCVGVLDQTYFLMGLGVAERLQRPSGDALVDLKRRLAAKTLLLPGGLGSTHKVAIFERGMGHVRLLGCSYRVRVT